VHAVEHGPGAPLHEKERGGHQRMCKGEGKREEPKSGGGVTRGGRKHAETAAVSLGSGEKCSSLAA
jgi:hypothetical protein